MSASTGGYYCFASAGPEGRGSMLGSHGRRSGLIVATMASLAAVSCGSSDGAAETATTASTILAPVTTPATAATAARVETAAPATDRPTTSARLEVASTMTIATRRSPTTTRAPTTIRSTTTTTLPRSLHVTTTASPVTTTSPATTTTATTPVPTTAGPTTTLSESDVVAQVIFAWHYTEQLRENLITNPTLDNLDQRVAEITEPGSQLAIDLETLIRDMVAKNERVVRGEPDYSGTTAESVELLGSPPFTEAMVTYCTVTNVRRVDASGATVLNTDGLVAYRASNRMVLSPLGWVQADGSVFIWNADNATECPDDL